MSCLVGHLGSCPLDAGAKGGADVVVEVVVIELQLSADAGSSEALEHHLLIWVRWLAPFKEAVDVADEPFVARCLVVPYRPLERWCDWRFGAEMR